MFDSLANNLMQKLNENFEQFIFANIYIKWTLTRSETSTP